MDGDSGHLSLRLLKSFFWCFHAFTRPLILGIALFIQDASRVFGNLFSVLEGWRGFYLGSAVIFRGVILISEEV